MINQGLPFFARSTLSFDLKFSIPSAEQLGHLGSAMVTSFLINFL
jgi:hypothetical protein|tara:strand:+ start:141 stop:275 length:135 start_codon:yes stop_codon:yes gene_type:complete